jgi:EAL domain-containing protein (putative c-di-GMP-specific phosphodiesterase class I)
MWSGSMAENINPAPLYSLIASASEAAPGNGMLERSLQAIRAHLGMEVAYVSEFVGNRTIFRHVDAPGLEALIKVGDSHSLDDVYCRHILEGRLPQLIADTSTEPVAMAMAITQAVPIGKHLSVPIRMPDGSVHGMFCCFGFKADHSLQERDMQMMKVFADLAAFEISRDLEATNAIKEKEDRIRTVIENNQISIVYQPIWKFEELYPVGFECLARFSAAPYRSPDAWFTEAAETGDGARLELTAIRLALSAVSSLPKNIYLAVNASPETILSGELHDTLNGMPAERIVLEITEHAHVENYDSLMHALQPLRNQGVRLAVDDAGAGYSSLQHILQLRPDLIKLDMGLVRNIDRDPARRALASALVLFARETGSQIIAEGVETAFELNALQSIGVERAQGYFLGRPMSLEEAKNLFNRERQLASCVA